MSTNPSLHTFETAAFKVFAGAKPTGPLRRRFQGARIRRETERFIKLLYRVEPGHLKTIEHWELIERLTTLVRDVVAVYVLKRYGHRDSVECQVFYGLIEQLREGIDGLRQGLAPDPQKRPTPEQLRTRAGERLLSTLRSA